MPLVRVRGHTFVTQLLSSGSVVLDLGAHKGSFSHELIARFGCTCIAVEANPYVSATIAPEKHLTVVNKAVSSEPGSKTFYVYGRLESSSLNPRSDRGKPDEVLVSVTTLAQLFADHGGPRVVDLVKLDVEGAEVDVLDACPDSVLSEISQITVEFHDFNGLVRASEVNRIIERMHDLGFHSLNMWMRNHGDTLFVNGRCLGAAGRDLTFGRYAVKPWWWSRKLTRKFLRLTPVPGD